MLIKSFTDEYARYRSLCEIAMARLSDDALNRVVVPDGNSVAMIVRHMSGNLISRFTDFLTTDGEKPWRSRDEEFEERTYTRAEVSELWGRGWAVIESQLATLTDADLDRQVAIGGKPLSVHEALSRSLAHMAYHVGQVVVLARMLADREWVSLSIPKGKSAEYAANPTREKKPG